MNKFHRFLSLVLCLALVLFCLSVPFRSSAAADAGFVSISLGGSFVSVSGAVAVAVLVLSGLGIVWGSIEEAVAEAKLWYNAVPNIVKDWLDKAGQEVVEGHTTVKIPETVIEGINSVDEAHQLSPASPYLDTSVFNLDTISPTDLFAQDVVGAIQQSGSTTHSLLRTLYGLLNTEFTEIGEFISDQTSAISTGFTDLSSKLTSIKSHVLSLWSLVNTSFDDVELSIDTMSSSLSKGLTDLKTLYSSFGNATLSKLDTLNQSIQALDFSSFSADILDLYNLIAQNDALTISALQNLPDQISDSISSFFETQSLQLESISDKLGAESSYLLDLVGDMQLIRDDVANGFADLKVALDSLSVNISAEDLNFDFDPVVDQIFDSETTLVGQFVSLYSLINDNIAAYTGSNNELLSSIQDFTAGWDQMFLEYFDHYYNQLNSLNESLYQLTYQALCEYFDVTLSTFVEQISENSVLLEQGLSSVRQELELCWMTIEDSIDDTAELVKTDVIDQLKAIKTAVQTIAGTTTADPSPGGDNSQDDYEKEKAPLMPWVGSGFEIGGSYFNSIQGFLGDDMDAFLVAGMIFEEFAGMTFFYKLIIISCSVGLIGTLLGMALQLQSYSVAQRRREEAAQSKAHNRMERSYAA